MQRVVWVVLAIVIYLGMGTNANQPSAMAQRVRYALVIHGGAGTAPSTDDWRDGRTKVLTQALQTLALDTLGNLAAGTSTGGLTNKRYGRLGDSPIVGAGTFADNDTCAVSATGVGEDFIRNAVAYDVSARMKYRNDSLDDAIQAILHDEVRVVRGGLIGVSRHGEISMRFNTAQMAARRG